MLIYEKIIVTDAILYLHKNNPPCKSNDLQGDRSYS